MIQTETATVYRGGGRRWFSLAAAEKAEAKGLYRAAIKAKDRCGCEYEEFDSYGRVNYPCHYHDCEHQVYARYIRYVSRIIKRGAT